MQHSKHSRARTVCGEISDEYIYDSRLQRKCNSSEDCRVNTWVRTYMRRLEQ